MAELIHQVLRRTTTLTSQGDSSVRTRIRQRIAMLEAQRPRSLEEFEERERRVRQLLDLLSRRRGVASQEDQP